MLGLVFDPSRYPANWIEIRRQILTRAGGRCECAGECGSGCSLGAGRCGRRNGEPQGGYRVVLTTAHLWRGPCSPCAAVGRKCGDPDHLKAMCQRCHLGYDREQHVAIRRKARRAAKAVADLFDHSAP